MTATGSGHGTRRAFLTSVGACLGLGYVAVALSRGARTNRREDLRRAAVHLNQDEAAARLGRVYLADHPEEANVARLLDALDAEMSRRHRGVVWTGHVEALRSGLREAVRRDFEQHRIENVAGWRLARTEARMCALAHLADSRDEDISAETYGHAPQQHGYTT